MPRMRRRGSPSSSASRRWNPSGISAAPSFRPRRALIAYVDKTQIAKRPPIEPPKRLSDRETMRIDAATRANLELFRSTSGGAQRNAVAAIDRTRSAAGSRLLAERLASPLCRPGARSTSVLTLFSSSSSGRRCEPPSGRARRRAGHASRAVAARARPRRPARSRHDPRRPGGGRRISQKLQNPESGEIQNSRSLAPVLIFTWTMCPSTSRRRLRAALADDLPLLKRDGGFVRRGYDAALDEALALRDESRKMIAGLQARYAERDRHPLAENQAQQLSWATSSKSPPARRRR